MSVLDPVRRSLEQAGFEVMDRESGRAGIERFAIRDGDVVAEGGFYPGNRHIRTWIELSPRRSLQADSERDRSLFTALASSLEPGGYLMVHYGTLETTKEALNVDIPPQATPLGFLLWEAGCRWYKDWYIAEGAREGGQKLQGNLPVDAATRKQREAEAREKLQAFLERGDGSERCRELAEQAMEQI